MNRLSRTNKILITNLFKDVREEKGVYTDCWPSFYSKLKDFVSNCENANLTDKATCFTFEEIMTDLKRIQTSKNCFQKNLGLGPYSKLWKAELSQFHPAVTKAINSEPHPQCISEAIEWWTNMYKPCATFDQEQLAVIRRYGMELSIIDCRFYELHKVCFNKIL